MENKIKIGYLIGSSDIGGTEKMILTLVKNLDKNKFEIIFFCIKGKGRFTEKLKEENFKVYIVNLKKNPFSFINLFFILKRENLDILQSFLFVANILGRIYGKILGIKLIISSQRSTDPWRKWYHWFLERITKRWVDLIISNSYSAKEILIKKGRIPRKKIKVIPNGIQILENLEKVEKKDFIVIGTIGNLKKAKGYFYLIDAAKIVIEKFKNVRFYIIGEGELKQEILKRIKKYSIEQYFVLTGYVENIYDYLRIFDIFVLPSLWEGCPVSLLESMGYGIASIATDVGDVPYIIENGETGYIVKSGDYKKMAERIINLIENKELREKIGQKAREKIKKDYYFEEMVKAYASTYNKVDR
ncbi:MAG: glycosyltransferase [Candidatus Omnitrophica bacterium]|nr:glycosyltransferase [Candidatus Omnitrophota bacterium]MCM8802450.1 glycosyltransferase [Candidatus Omnitrophota bacterium]